MAAGLTAVRLFGAVEVDRDGSTTPVEAPKECTILAALALAAPRVVTVDELHRLLWDDDPPATATKTVQNYVSRLRRVVGTDALLHRGGGYQLRVQSEAVDARRFETSVRLGRELLAAGDAVAALARLDDADGMWRGPLGIDTSMPAAMTIAARFRELRSAQRELRSEAALLGGADVSAELELDIGADPTRERLWELLALACLRDNRVADGLRAVQRARAALADVGLPIGARLRHVEQRLLSSSLGEELTSSSVRPALPSSFDRRDAYPLVGRDEQISTLRRAWRDAQAGRANAVVVVGPAGYGKSRLLASGARAAHDEGGVVAVGLASEIGVSPFAVVIDPILEIAQTDDAEQIRRLLARRVDDEELDPWRRELVAACRAAVEAAARTLPVMFAVEDLHWADPSSIRLFHALVTATRGRVLWATTLRPAGRPDGETETFLSEAHRFGHATVLEVGRLSADEVLQLLRAARGPEASSDFAEELARVTGGSPFLLTEVLRSAATFDGAVPLPSAVRDIVATRLARSTPDARQTVVAAAVLGEQIDARTVAAMTGLDGGCVIRHLDAAVADGTLADGERSGPFTSYRFAHDLTRQAVYESATRLDRAALHIAAARHCIRERAPAAVIARHFVAARATDVVEDAITWCRRAADDAARRRGFEDAAAWIATALDADELSAAGPRRRAVLLYERGLHLNAAGHTDPGRAVLAQAAEIADDPQLLARVAIAYADSSGAYIDPADQRGRRMLARAQALLPPQEFVLRAQVINARVGWMLLDPDPEPRLALAEELSRLAVESGDPAIQSLALGSAHDAARGIRDRREQLELCERQWALGGRMATGMEAVILRLRLWNDRIGVGDVSGALAAVESMRLLGQSGSDTAMFYAHLFEAFHAYMDGDLDGATAAADAAAAEPVALGMGIEVNMRVLRSAIAALRGDSAESLRLTQEIVRVAPPYAKLIGTDLAVECLRRADPGFAKHAIDEWAKALRFLPAAIRSTAAATCARWAWRVGSPDALRAMYDVLDMERGYWIAPFPVLPRGRAELPLGLLLAGMGEYDRALTDIETAHDVHVAVEAWGLAAESAAALSEVRAVASSARRNRHLRAIR